MTKERIEIIRQSLIPFVKKELLEINYDGLGKSDAKEFEKDLNEVLDLASKSLEQPTSDDCVSRQAVLDKAWDVPYEGKYIQVVDVGDIQELPPVTPTRKVGKWIYHFERDDYNDYENEYYECPFCHDLGGDKYYHYCPVCGNKVKGVENGSD